MSGHFAAGGAWRRSPSVFARPERPYRKFLISLVAISHQPHADAPILVRINGGPDACGHLVEPARFAQPSREFLGEALKILVRPVALSLSLNVGLGAGLDGVGISFAACGVISGWLKAFAAAVGPDRL